MHIGIFGGTFNPIHNGHLSLSSSILNTMGLDKIIFVPCARPPHKEDCSVSFEHRCKMIELAIKPFPKFSIDTRENLRPGKSYTVDTLKSFRAEYGEHCAISMIIGMDSYNSLQSWHNFTIIPKLANIIVSTRDNIEPKLETVLNESLEYSQELEGYLASPAGKLIFHKSPPLSVSSTLIRENISKNHSIDSYLPPEVGKYIETNQLYRVNI